jgi:hypothetical protein
MKIIIAILILVLSIANLSEDNRFPNVTEREAELICIQEGIYDASDY